MNILGIDIGTSHIKAVSIEREKSNKLLRYSVGPSRGMAQKLLSESQHDIKELAEYIKEFLLEEGYISTKAIAVLPDHKVFTKVITMPVIGGKEFEAAVRWEAEQHLPHQLSDIYLKHTILKQYGGDAKKTTELLGKLTGKKGEKKADGVMEVLLVAAPKSTVDKYLSLLNKAGLEPIGLEPSSLSTIRSTMVSDISVPTIIVDFGYNNVNFYLAVNNTLRFVRTINFAVSSIVRIISQELDVSPTQAAEYLYTYGLKDDELSGKIKEIILPVIKIIVDELKKSQDFVEKRPALMGDTHYKNIKRIILSGGGALIPNLIVYMIQEINTEVEYANPWESVDISSIKGDNKLDDYGPLFAAAVGAALKGI